MLNEKILTKKELDNPAIDIRKEYIVRKYGEETYEFESDMDFMSFPEKMFDYKCDYQEILTINHEYHEDHEE